MARFLDSDNKPIRKGFYRYFHERQLFYFTGEYNPNKNNVPIFKNEYNNVENFISQDHFYANFTKNLSKVTKRKVKEQLKDLKEKVNFLEKNLEDLRK